MYLFTMPRAPVVALVLNQAATVIGYELSAGWWTTLT